MCFCSFVICTDNRAINHETSTTPSSKMPTIFYAVSLQL